MEVTVEQPHTTTICHNVTRLEVQGNKVSIESAPMKWEYAMDVTKVLVVMKP